MDNEITSWHGDRVLQAWLCVVIIDEFYSEFKISEIQIALKTSPYYIKYKILSCIVLHILDIIVSLVGHINANNFFPLYTSRKIMALAFYTKI